MCVASSKHISDGSSPWELRLPRGAPTFSRITTRLHRDIRAATWRGVQPATSARSNEGRCLSSSCRTPAEPALQATCTPVVLLESCANGDAPKCNSHLTTTTLEELQKCRKCRSKEFSPCSVSGKTAPAGHSTSMSSSSKAPQEPWLGIAVTKSR